MPQLSIQESGQSSVFELFPDDPEVGIGRGGSNAVQVRDSHASKVHGALRLIGARWKLVDLESRNGIKVNGSFRNQHWLLDGDTISIGEARVRFSGPAASPAAAPAAASAGVRAPAAAPPAPFASAPAPAAAAPPSRRRRAEPQDDDPDDRRPAARRKDNGGLIVLLGVIGVGVFVMLMIKFLEPPVYLNRTVRMQADQKSASGDLEGAIAYAEEYGDPSAVYWHDLRRDIERWKGQLEMRPMLARNAEAASWFEQNVVRRTYTSMFRAKDAMSESEAAGVLREFLATYGDTPKARELLHSDVKPFPEYRQMMRSNASADADPGRIMAAVRTDIDLLAARRRFKDAIDRLEDLKAAQQVLLVRERAEEVRRMADQRISELREQARSAFDRDMDEVRRHLREDQKDSARSLLEEMIEIYGLPNLVNEAKLKLDEL